MAHTVKLTDAVLLGLSRQPHVRRKFPVFKTLYDNLTQSSCHRCAGKKARQKRQHVLASIKTSIAGSSEDTILALKRLVGATKLVVYVQTTKGPKKN